MVWSLCEVIFRERGLEGHSNSTEEREVAVGKALREGINETKLPLMIRNRAREFRSGSPLNSVHLSIS